MDNLLELRMTEYDDVIGNYRDMEPVVVSLLQEELNNAGIRVMQVAHRIKTRESVAEKMERKPDKYTSPKKMTDLLGVRIICYFNDQVDQIAEIVREKLVVDPENSVDKRKLLDPTAFGYLSLHFICTLPKDSWYPEEICDLKFEIQIRTVLQHTWAEIEHDLGYKTEFGIPRDLRRSFSRVAGLLEVADDAFLRIRASIKEYDRDVRDKITNDKAGDMPLDLVTLRAYIELSKTMQSLIHDIAAISNSTVIETSPEQYLRNLEFFNIHTLGELSRFVHEGYESAVKFAKKSLGDIQLDEVSSIIGLYYLCRARLVQGDYNERQLMVYYMIGEATENKARRQTRMILQSRDSWRKEEKNKD